MTDKAFVILNVLLEILEMKEKDKMFKEDAESRTILFMKIREN